MRWFVWFASAAAACFVAACGGGAQPPPYKPTVDTKTMMQAMVDPAAVRVWNSVRYVVTADGEEAFRPQTDAEWIAVRNDALIVSESGNLIMMPPRAKDDGEWMRIAQAMVMKGNQLREAADAHDVDKIFTLGGELYDICTNCHVKYLKAIVDANK